MKKQTEWVCGNVNVTATLTLPDNTPAGIAILAVGGLTQELQRKPSSAWEKVEAGYEKRPEGFKRDSIDYSEESAAKLIKAFEGALPAGVEVSFETSQKVEGDTAKPSKESQDLWAKVQALKGGELNNALKALGLDDTSDDDAGIAACHKHMREAKRAAAEAAKKTLMG